MNGAALRITIVGLAFAALACQGDPLVSPSAPDLSVTGAQLSGEKKPPGDFKVCVAFRDGSDRIASDGNGDYCNDRQTVALVGERFRLDTNKSDRAGKGRTVHLDFNDCVSDCSPPFLDGAVEIDMRSQDPLALNAMAVGSQGRTNLVVGMTSGLENMWWLVYGPPLAPFLGCPNTDGVTVTRDSETQWTIEASTSPLDEACLVEGTDDGVQEARGRFRVPFKITMTAQ